MSDFPFEQYVLRAAGMLSYVSESDAHGILVGEGVDSEMAHWIIRGASLMVRHGLA